jgi:hypothetical protein
LNKQEKLRLIRTNPSSMYYFLSLKQRELPTKYKWCWSVIEIGHTRNSINKYYIILMKLIPIWTISMQNYNLLAYINTRKSIEFWIVIFQLQTIGQNIFDSFLPNNFRGKIVSWICLDFWKNIPIENITGININVLIDIKII